VRGRCYRRNHLLAVLRKELGVAVSIKHAAHSIPETPHQLDGDQPISDQTRMWEPIANRTEKSSQKASFFFCHAAENSAISRYSSNPA